MRPIKFPGFTNVYHAPEGWDEEENGECSSLHVLESTSGLISVWKPSFREIMQMLFGKKLALCVMSTAQPPVALYIVDVPEQKT